MGGSDGATNKCGLTELLVFIAAIITGTGCSICSKTMMELRGIGITGEEEIFRKPMFQTFGMFVGMIFGLVMHWVVVYFKIPFPGYPQNDKPNDKEEKSQIAMSVVNYGSVESGTEQDSLLNNEGDAKSEPMPKFPVWMYFFMAIPSVFDLGATAFCMMGLQYIDVSIYQLLRGSGIIFVALMKQHVLGDRLYTYQWVGVAWNVVSVFLVGGTAILNEGQATDEDSHKSSQALLGVLLVMVGAFVQALQYVFEEKVMTMDIPSPPLLLIGIEGLWGTILCLVVVYPLVYYLPGDDHGSYEDPFNTYAMFMNTRTIQLAFVFYFFVIFFYNLFAVLVTFMLSSVWHAILDNFRPITIWITDLIIFYWITSSGDFGEPWTKWSWVQVIGMIVLLYGTAIYNAPNSGSIKLEGQWYSFGFNYTNEYKEVEYTELDQEDEEKMDADWQARAQSFKTRTESSFYGEHSPHVSVHTQALRGLGTPKL